MREISTMRSDSVRHIENACVSREMRKGPQRTTKDRKGDRQYHKGPTKDCKRTLRAKLQEIGTNWTQWCLIFQCAPRFLHTAGLSWEPALSDSQSVRRGRPHHLWTWKFLRLSHQKHRLSVADWKALSEPRSGSASGTLCSRWHVKALLHGTHSPGALVKILAKSGKNVIKLIFSEQARDIIYINISKAQENPPRAYLRINLRSTSHPWLFTDLTCTWNHNPILV